MLKSTAGIKNKEVRPITKPVGKLGPKPVKQSAAQQPRVAAKTEVSIPSTSATGVYSPIYCVEKSRLI